MGRLKAGSIAALLLGTALALPAQAQEIPAPKAVLGHDVGEDYYLATYEDSVAYFQKLAASSDRIKMFTAGKTTQGRELTYAVISSPENLAQYEHYKDISRRLAAAKGLDDAAAKALAAEGKIIVHIDGGMHSSEVSAHQSAIALAYKLVGSKGDPDVDAVLKNVIVVLWPTLNPDGMDMVVNWYRQNRGTKYETSGLPWLYQEYVGHDNNRDGYMLNMLESQNIFHAEQEYSPEIWYSHHQTAPYPARIWVPPFSDPMSPNISPYVRMWTTTLGINMMDAFEAKQMPGAIAQARFDNWYAGFLDYTHAFRNTMSFFTEVAHASATPKLYELKTFPKNMQDLRPTIFYPSPWKGGMWHLSDSVAYDTVASMSVLDTAVRYHEVLLYNRYQAGRDTIKKYASDGPFAYVIPAGQKDAPEAALLAQKLIQQGVTVHQATAAVTLGGKPYPAGSWVILMDQPFANLVPELFEPQKYPDSILDGGGKPVDLPYDVTGWTLPMQMGVTTAAITQKLTPDALAALKPVEKAEATGGVTGSGSAFVLSRDTNASFLVANAAAKKGAKLGFSSGPVTTANGEETGAIVITGIARDALQALAAEHGATVTAMAEVPATTTVKPARVALYRPWGQNIDEGWTRWILEQYGYGPTSLHNVDVQKGGLRAKYDTIVLPDIRNMSSLLNGLSPNEVPPEYAGGIGDLGSIALKKFVEDGGTLVALNSSADAVVDLFNLPVTNVVKNLRSEEFFCSGALLQLKLTTPSRASAGMASDPIVMFERGPVFSPTGGFKGKVLASYPTEGNALKSGVMLHPERVRGKAAALEVEYGKGRIFLYGFKPQWRGQSHAAYKLLFNLFYTYPQQEESTLTVPVEGRL
jgi:hypothetical protein